MSRSRRGGAKPQSGVSQFASHHDRGNGRFPAFWPELDADSPAAVRLDRSRGQRRCICAVLSDEVDVPGDCLSIDVDRKGPFPSLRVTLSFGESQDDLVKTIGDVE